MLTIALPDGLAFAQYCQQAGRFDGDPASLFTVASVDECRQACADNYPCNYYKLDGRTNTCSLYENVVDGDGSPDLQSVYGYVYANC